MHHFLSKTLTLFLFLFANFAHAETVNVFFAGGQSNAKLEWANGIEAALVNSNRYENVLVVHEIHSGNWLQSWYLDGAQQDNYRSDFFNASGTGALQTALTGANTVFSGFFWFQGEGDSGWSVARDAYAERFNGMLNDILASTPNIDKNFQTAFSIIDAEYDNYELPGGRTPADINAMRDVLFSMAGDNHYDTRGLERTDIFHLTPDALFTAGYGLGDTFATTPVPLPAAFWLLFSAVMGLFFSKKKTKHHIA